MGAWIRVQTNHSFHMRARKVIKCHWIKKRHGTCGSASIFYSGFLVPEWLMCCCFVSVDSSKFNQSTRFDSFFFFCLLQLFLLSYRKFAWTFVFLVFSSWACLNFWFSSSYIRSLSELCFSSSHILHFSHFVCLKPQCFHLSYIIFLKISSAN